MRSPSHNSGANIRSLGNFDAHKIAFDYTSEPVTEPIAELVNVALASVSEKDQEIAGNLMELFSTARGRLFALLTFFSMSHKEKKGARVDNGETEFIPIQVATIYGRTD